MPLCIGNPTGATLFVGATHGLEWLTCMLLHPVLREYAEALETGGKVSDIDVGRLLCNRSLVIVPCLNPDGRGNCPAGYRRGRETERTALKRCCRGRTSLGVAGQRQRGGLKPQL